MATDWESLARSAARRTSTDEAPSARREFVGFRLAGESYALPVERIREIARVGPITPVPRLPDVMLGVVSLRGEIVQVVDLRLRLGCPAASRSRSQRILVVRAEGGGVTGFLVDEVTNMLRMSEGTLRAPPSGSSEFVWALCVEGDGFVSLLDPDRLAGLHVEC